MRLIADIGGTNARFALCDHQFALPRRIETFACKDFSGLVEAANHYLQRVGEQPKSAVLALATDVHGDQIKFVNNHWVTTKQNIKSGLALDELMLLNDFEAIAWSLPELEDNCLLRLGAGQADPTATKTAVGPGTGLGVAQFIKTGSNYIVQATEGGFASFVPQDAIGQAVLDYWRERDLMLIRENFLSGPGLSRIHTAFSGGDELHPVNIVHGAHTGDELCLKAVEQFCAMLGDVCADQALATGARGGVYIAGGIVPRFADLLVKSSFRTRFETRGKRSDYLKAIPTWLITEPQPGLRGACAIATAQ